MLLGLGLVGLAGVRGPEVWAASWTLAGWVGGGLEATLGSFDLGVGSGLGSSASLGATGWTSDLATGK